MNVFYLSLKKDTPANGFWDYGLLNDLFEGTLGFTDTKFDCKEVSRLYPVKEAIVVIPARSHFELIDKINRELKKVDKAQLFLMGDEEHVFPVEQIDHPQIKIWVQNPMPGRHDPYRKLGTGYPQKSQEILPRVGFLKDVDVFFSGQITHERRKDMWKELTLWRGSKDVHATQGFTQGLPHEEYYRRLAKSKIAPAPSGPETPDSFRLFEALESMSIPIADEQNPSKSIDGYWDWLFDDLPPFPKIKSYDNLSNYFQLELEAWPTNVIRQTAWWINWKRKFAHEVCDYFNNSHEGITVVIPISPIKSHPETNILEETIASIRQHLDCEIILCFDGVREEQKDWTPQYQEHILKMLWKSLHEYRNVVPIVFETHEHQSGMMKKMIDKIKTPLLMYVEQDTPLTENPIDWEKIKSFIMTGQAHTVRLHHENVIPEEHKSLVLGQENGFIKTYQYSQRPHVSSVVYYREMLKDFPDGEFIEDRWHGVVMRDYNDNGMLGWYKHRLWIYAPEGGLKRSYHLDGRAGEKKYTSDDK